MDSGNVSANSEGEGTYRSGVQGVMRPCPTVIPGRSQGTAVERPTDIVAGPDSDRHARVAKVPHSEVKGHKPVRTPHRITAAEFSDLLKHFLDTCCVLCGNTLCCAVCGTPIEHVRAALSVHNSASGSCQGPRIWTTAVPYCPRCEEEPERGGCLHFILNVFPKAS